MVRTLARHLTIPTANTAQEVVEKAEVDDRNARIAIHSATRPEIPAHLLRYCQPKTNPPRIKNLDGDTGRGFWNEDRARLDDCFKRVVAIRKAYNIRDAPRPSAKPVL